MKVSGNAQRGQFIDLLPAYQASQARKLSSDRFSWRKYTPIIRSRQGPHEHRLYYMRPDLSALYPTGEPHFEQWIPNSMLFMGPPGLLHRGAIRRKFHFGRLGAILDSSFVGDDRTIFANGLHPQ